MSYREMRAFTEKMRSLGYPKPISMESFRGPNFDLVSDILYWLIKSYDPAVDVTHEIGEEYERVMFIKTIATYFASKANLKLNTRKLYMADGYAVKELLKIAQLLYDAKTIHGLHETDELPAATLPLDVTNKLSQLKVCRTLATEITEKGASLYDLLGKELRLRDIRTSVISRPLELPLMEKAVTDSIKRLQETVQSTKLGLENLHSDESSLLTKIDKKKVELDRAEKRLKSLQAVRPAYMDEYERIEVELVSLYQNYVERFRNLSFLEQQLDEHNREEQEKLDEADISMKRMQDRLREEELRLLRGERESHHHGSGTMSSRPQRPAAAGSRSRGLDNQEDDFSDSEPIGMDDDGVSVGSGFSSGEILTGGDDFENGNSQANSVTTLRKKPKGRPTRSDTQPLSQRQSRQQKGYGKNEESDEEFDDHQRSEEFDDDDGFSEELGPEEDDDVEDDENDF